MFLDTTVQGDINIFSPPDRAAKQCTALSQIIKPPQLFVSFQRELQCFETRNMSSDVTSRPTVDAIILVF